MASNILDTILGSSPTLYTTIIVCLVPLVVVVGLAFSQQDAIVPPPAGCRKLGITGRSNLHDQSSKRYAMLPEALDRLPTPGLSNPCSSTR
jgi:hypothetical protein